VLTFTNVKLWEWGGDGDRCCGDWDRGCGMRWVWVQCSWGWAGMGFSFCPRTNL